MLKEFRAFVMRGNVVDLAVGVIIGGAFGKIVSSLVDDVLMPPIGLALGGVNFSDLFVVLRDAPKSPGPYASLDAARKAGAAVLAYGAFVNTIVTFVIIAFAVFLLIKAINSLNRPAAEAPAPPAPTAEETLLTEIRDLLKAGKGT